MFYSQFILAKKGPLGTIWIAAHLERKLRKNQVTETNISVSVGKFYHHIYLPRGRSILCIPRVNRQIILAVFFSFQNAQYETLDNTQVF